MSFAEENDGIKIHDALNEYEEVLTKLVESITKFHPTVDIAADLIEANNVLQGSIEELKVHYECGKKIKSLKAESDDLDKQLNTLLIGLSDCRRELMSLPGSLIEQEFEPPKLVNSDKLLKYATKITKFTHAPPKYNPQMPEHANFPWPTEDEMRRGVLAFAATHTEDESDKPTAAQEQAFQPVQRRGSLVSYGEPMDAVADVREQPKVLDLDLFDPDDDDE